MGINAPCGIHRVNNTTYLPKTSKRSSTCGIHHVNNATYLPKTSKRLPKQIHDHSQIMHTTPVGFSACGVRVGVANTAESLGATKPTAGGNTEQIRKSDTFNQQRVPLRKITTHGNTYSTYILTEQYHEEVHADKAKTHAQKPRRPVDESYSR